MAPSWAPVLTRRAQKKLRLMARVGDLVADCSNAVYDLVTADLLEEVPVSVLSILLAQLVHLTLVLREEVERRGLR